MPENIKYNSTGVENLLSRIFLSPASWKKRLLGILILGGLLGLSGCGPANQQVGLCTYLGGCDSKEDPTAYTSPTYAGKEVGLCSYLGGCMEDSGDSGPAIGPPKRQDSVGGDSGN